MRNGNQLHYSELKEYLNETVINNEAFLYIHQLELV